MLLQEKDKQNTSNNYQKLISFALKEDLLPAGDITCNYLIDPKQTAEAKIIAKEKGVLACSFIAQEILDETRILIKEINGLDLKAAQIKFHINDGDHFSSNETIAELKGPAHLILAAERTILNFLQRLSGVATKTNHLVKLISSTKTQLLDTRKTLPGLRFLEKKAFQDGGGTNHRYNLSDMVLIKENHLIFQNSKSLSSAIEKARLANPEIKIECEISKEAELEEVIKAGVDIIMLDNFSPERIKSAIKLIKEIKTTHNIDKEIKLEASGGINEFNISNYAKTGIDFISVGAVTTQVHNIDLSMLITHHQKRHT